jgi:hypothetical protein
MKNERNELLIQLRPIIKSSKTLDNTNQFEAFQNNTLRPIIKFQHDLSILLLKSYLNNNKFELGNSTTEKISAFISTALKKDKQLNLQVIHTITGFLTTEEFEYYTQNKKETHKRITQICTERYLTNLEQLY